jgi:dihydroorotase
MRDGTIDLVSTDHAPHLRAEKEPGWTDGWKAHTGTPSTQFYLSLLLDAVQDRRIGLERVVEMTSTAPAKVFHLADKGRLEVGADADVVIVDLDEEMEIRDEMVLSKCGWTPYAGRNVRGVVKTTISRGEIVFDNGQVIGLPGRGRQARPSEADPAQSPAVTAKETAS